MMASGLRSAPELEGVSCQLAVALRGADARPTNLQKEDVRERGAAEVWALKQPKVSSMGRSETAKGRRR